MGAENTRAEPAGLEPLGNPEQRGEARRDCGTYEAGR